ncbi:MAG: anti-sigma factor domain-containing protein [Nitriliruptoraceae bacterium]
MVERPDLHTLTGAYAVDALPDGELAVFEAHLEACTPCAQEVRELQATAARLGGAAVAAVPDSLKARVLAEIDATRQERPEAALDDELPVAPRTTPRWVAATFAAAAALLVVAVGGLAVMVTAMQQQLAGLEAEVVAAEAANAEVEALTARLAQVEAAAASATSSAIADVLAAPDAVTVAVELDGVHGRVVASATRGEAVFVADGFDPAPHAHTYELWFIHDDRVVPAGLFDPDERGRATRVMTGDVAGAVAVGITIEPEGGSVEPSGDPMMVLTLG